MQKKFDPAVAEKLGVTLLNTAEIMEVETENIQKSFKVLGETFRDQAYNEFQGELNAADKTMASIIEDMKSLSKAVLRYRAQMIDLL